MSDDEGDNVGYGKPPRQHRFKPGQSGNPKGRKPAPADMDAFMDFYLKGKVEVKENGRKMRRSRKQIIVIRQVGRAMEGDDRAVERIMKHDRERGRRDLTVETADKEVVEAALRRLGGAASKLQATADEPEIKGDIGSEVRAPYPVDRSSE